MTLFCHRLEFMPINIFQNISDLKQHICIYLYILYLVFIKYILLNIYGYFRFKN